MRGRLRRDAGEAAVALRVVYAGMAAYAVLFVVRRGRPLRRLQDARGSTSGTWSRRSGTRCTGISSRRRPLTGHQRDRLGFHVDPFLLLFVPLFWIWSSPLLLPSCRRWQLRAERCRSSGSRASISARPGRAPTSRSRICSTRRRSSMHSRPTSSFHSVAIAVPLVLYAIWFLDEDRLVAFSVVACLPARRRRRSRSRSAVSESGTPSVGDTGCSGSASSR